jgi:hypothetical protein
MSVTLISVMAALSSPCAKSAGPVGNTKTGPQPNPCVHWLFTWNNYPPDWKDKMCSIVPEKVKRWMVTAEVGEEGTPHLHWYLHLKKKARLMTILAEAGLPRLHCEKVNNKKNYIEYCLKDGDALWTNIPYQEKIRDPLIDKALYPFQQWVEDICKTPPDDRTIYWVYDPAGCSGKSALVKHLCLSLPRSKMVWGEAKRCFAVIAKEKIKPHNVFVNLSRTSSRVDYEALELIKDGHFISTMNDPEECMMNNPHLWVFSNQKPLIYAVTPDRWVFIKLYANGEFYHKRIAGRRIPKPIKPARMEDDRDFNFGYVNHGEDYDEDDCKDPADQL